MVILSHPTGNTFVRAAARTLYANRTLHTFYTTVSASPRVARWFPPRMRYQLMRRWYADIPLRLIKTKPARELVRLAGSALGVHAVTRPGAWASVDSVYRQFDAYVARAVKRLPRDTAVSAVYCYEDGAERTFAAARARNLACVYELPIAYWETTQRLLREEAERMPDWRPTLRGVEDSREKLNRKVREIESADLVVVPSRFVLETLPERVRRETICVVAPFGSPLPQHLTLERSGEAPRAPLRILFAGALTQRKGLGDLFAAMRLLSRSDLQLVVMGSLMASMDFYRERYRNFVYEPPRPHHQVLTLMQGCDVLVLPTIVEGRALVQQEALSSGLPLIVTPNAGGDDLVEMGRTGFVVPIRSPEAIAERLAWFADHRDLLPAMRQHALRKAAETGWSRYEACVRDAVAQATHTNS